MLFFGPLSRLVSPALFSFILFYFGLCMCMCLSRFWRGGVEMDEDGMEGRGKNEAGV